MISKVIVLATMAFIGSLGVAAAQSAAVGTAKQPQAAAAPITREVHDALTHGGKIPNGANATSTGWHYVHATNCAGYYDGSTTWLYVFPTEGGYWYTSNLWLAGTIAPECAQGNWIAFYVYNTSGSWSEIWTYSFK